MATQPDKPVVLAQFDRKADGRNWGILLLGFLAAAVFIAAILYVLARERSTVVAHGARPVPATVTRAPASSSGAGRGAVSPHPSPTAGAEGREASTRS